MPASISNNLAWQSQQKLPLHWGIIARKITKWETRMFQGSPRAAGHITFTLSSLIHSSPGSCNQTVENRTFGINESAVADHARKRKLLSNLPQQLSRFLYILWHLYSPHLIQNQGTFDPLYRAGWRKNIPQDNKQTWSKATTTVNNKKSPTLTTCNFNSWS